jgi:hypothetical protein
MNFTKIMNVLYEKLHQTILKKEPDIHSTNVLYLVTGPMQCCGFGSGS